MATTEQVAMMIPHLKVGGNYLFEHIRKGAFVGTYMGQKPTPAGDPEDAIFLEVDVITEDGSGQEGLANSFIRDELNRKMRPPISKKFIRPSLVRTITSPGSATQKQIKEQFESKRAEIERAAAAAGVEPSYGALSLPTAKAIDKLSVPEVKAADKAKKLIYAAIAAGAAVALGIAGYLIGAN